MTLPAEHFAALYGADPDPWSMTGSWYEQRKRACVLAALPRRRYRAGFEPGCGTGLLSAGLARRCADLVCSDVAETALAQARARLADDTHVRVVAMAVPERWIDTAVDLVVISELGYYLDDADRALLWDRAVGSLEPGGTLVAVHWRHPAPGYPATGDQVHTELGRHPGLRTLVRHHEEDFLLDVLAAPPARSVARTEGVV